MKEAILGAGAAIAILWLLSSMVPSSEPALALTVHDAVNDGVEQVVHDAVNGAQPWNPWFPWANGEQVEVCYACGIMHDRGYPNVAGNDYLRRAGTPLYCWLEDGCNVTVSTVDGMGNPYIKYNGTLQGSRVEYILMHGEYVGTGHIPYGGILGTTNGHGNSSADHDHITLYVNGQIRNSEDYR